MLTDAEIGRELDAAVAESLGWMRGQFTEKLGLWVMPHGGDSLLPPYSTDNGLAVGLLIGYAMFQVWNLPHGQVEIEARRDEAVAIEVGVFAPACCRCFLELKNREAANDSVSLAALSAAVDAMEEPDSRDPIPPGDVERAV